MGWTYADIENKIRATTGRPDPSMMSSATIVDYVNKAYQFVIPKELKISWGYTYYQFFTEANVDQYIGPTAEFQTLNPQVWCDGFPIEWYQSPDLFYQDYPDRLNKQGVATGDGATFAYAFGISAFPVLPNSVYISYYDLGGIQQVAQDNGTGAFDAPFTGNINYQTGSVNISLFPTPANGTNITVSSETYMANRPQSILYFQSQPLVNSDQSTRDNTKVFVLRPVPDQCYLIKMQGIQIPTPFIGIASPSQVPFREDMGPLIAYAASLEIFADFNQMDQYQEALVQYNRYKDVSMQDTYEEYLYQRSVPAF